MAKRPKIDTSGGGNLKHNPFAALGPAPSEPVEPTEEPPEASPSDAHDARPTLRFAPKVVVRRETKGRGGKTITRVSGIDAAHREDLAAQMKKALGCGAVVEGDDVILLGSLVDRAADWLHAAGAKRVVRAG